jgi:hypothetical protein
MLAPLAIVALLIGGAQTAIVVSDEDTARNERPEITQPTIAQVDSAFRTDD